MDVSGSCTAASFADICRDEGRWGFGSAAFFLAAHVLALRSPPLGATTQLVIA
jgi:hypothetical protein